MKMKWLKVVSVLFVGVSAYAAGTALINTACSHEVTENINTAIGKAEEFLNTGAARNAADTKNLTEQLLDACANGDSDQVKRLISQSRNGGGALNINAVDQAGFTPLMYAAAGGFDVIVKELLQQPEINVRKTAGGSFTALMLACMEGYDKVIDEFMQKPDKLAETLNQVSAITENGQTLRYTALSWACVNKHPSLVRKLRSIKAKDPDNICGCAGY